MKTSQKSSASRWMPSRVISESPSIARVYGIGLTLLLVLCAMSLPAHANTPGQHSVSLSWQDSDQTVVSYNIYRGNAPGVCSGTPTPFASSTSKAFVDSSVTAGTEYVYAVSAVNSTGGESACSIEAQVTVPSAPQTPTNLQGTAK